MVVVVTGPPGAGKSTVAGHLVRHWTPSALVEGDAFFAFLRQGAVAPWLPDAGEQNVTVTRAAARAADTFARGGMTVVYDGVVGPWLLDEFRAGIGAPLHYAVLLPPESVCVERVRSRAGHGFTDLDAARHMYRDFARAVVDERHVVRNADTSPAALADRLAALVASGELAVRPGRP